MGCPSKTSETEQKIELATLKGVLNGFLFQARDMDHVTWFMHQMTKKPKIFIFSKFNTFVFLIRCQSMKHNGILKISDQKT